MYLLITIDTEGDNAWARKGYENSTKNARFLPRFQELCDAFGYKPTYLTSYEMAKDEFFIEFAADALKRGTCEVGLHPHPWNSPPQYKLTSDDMVLQPYLIEYPENIIREKVKVHTELLEDRLESKIYSHRAGRWAFNSTYAKILCEFGYKVDCSVTPYAKDIIPKRLDSEPVKVDLPVAQWAEKVIEILMRSVKRAEQFADMKDVMRVFPRNIADFGFRGVKDLYYTWLRP